MTGPLRHDRTVGAVRFVSTGAGVDLARASARHEAARAEVAHALGVDPAAFLLPRQVHGDRVLDVAGPWPDGPAEADGLLLTGPGTAAGVLAADCMPLLLGEPDLGLAAAVHVGRRGLQAGISVVAVSRLAAHGARRVHAQLGPTVCGRCYEVPAAMRDEVADVVPAAAATTRQGTPALDIVAGVVSQLQAAGAAHGLQVDVDRTWAGCTVEDPTRFSHRRDGGPGRHAGAVVVL